MSAADAWLDRPVAAIAAAVRAGQVSAGDLAEAAIARVGARNGALNAIVDFDAGEVRRAAAALDRSRAEGFDGPLLGVPFTVKDTIWVGERRVTQGSLLFSDFRPPCNALSVERLKRAGAVFLGMTNAPEFASWGFTDNKIYGLTRNPLDTSLTSGGSSGGAASALAAGLAPLALGTDGGGSGRRPAAHVGMVGFKPSAGAIPSPFGFAGFFLAQHLVTAPMARSVADVRTMFDVMAGADRRDPISVELDRETSFEGARIAFSPRLGLGVAVDRDVAETVAAAVQRLKAAGWNITTADPVWPQGTSESAFDALGLAAAAHLFAADFRRDAKRFSPNIAAMIERGLKLPAGDVAAALQASEATMRALAGFFEQFDFLLTPTTACVAWPADQAFPPIIEGKPAGPRGHAVFTPLFNHALVPAISLPCGQGRGGLPVGLQIVGQRGHDHRLLALSAAIEKSLATP